jgi:hypothetical protein
MKLHEEFKEYESMWLTEARDLDPVDKILHDLPHIKLEYEGFEDDWCEDHFNSADGHWQTGGTYYYDDFVYPVDAVDMFECLRDRILEKPGAKVSNELVAKYVELQKAWENTETPEEEEARGDEMELFLAQHLKEFVEIFNDELLDFFSERAYDWAVDHVDHYDDDDYWPEYYPDDED